MNSLKQIFVELFNSSNGKNLDPYRIRFSPSASQIFDEIEKNLLSRKIKKALGYLQTHLNYHRLSLGVLSRKALKEQGMKICKCQKLEGPYGSQVYELHMEGSLPNFYLYWSCCHDKALITVIHIKLCI